MISFLQQKLNICGVHIVSTSWSILRCESDNYEIEKDGMRVANLVSISIEINVHFMVTNRFWCFETHP